MDKDGNYTIKEWNDPNQDYDLDGMIFEIFKNDKGHYQLVHWTEEDLFNMVEEMMKFWDDDNFWDEVMNGYTNLNNNEYQDALNDAWNLINGTQGYNLTLGDDWNYLDNYHGNFDEHDLKREVWNKHQRHQGKLKKHRMDHVQEFTNFKRTNGKCRRADLSYDMKHVYEGGGPKDIYQKHVTNGVQCKRTCALDPKCTAFHFYLLDPGAKDNCWIWTHEGYSGNDREKAFCWVK